MEPTFVNYSVWNACNLRCRFCYNDQWRNSVQYFKDFEVMKLELQKLKEKVNGINIIWWEPLFYSRIFDLLDYIRDIWFDKISIVTNWVKLSDYKFAEKILSYNLRSIYISIHSHNPEIEDILTQRKGVFEKKLLWLRNVQNIIKEKRYSTLLQINVVANQKNIEVLSDIIAFYYGLWLRFISISWIILDTDCSDNNKEMVPRYSDIISQLDRIYDFNLKGLKLSVDWTPLCIHKNIKNRFYRIRELNVRPKYSLLETGENLLDFHKNYKIVLKKCKKCVAFNRLCFGVYSRYINKYWEEEFESLDEQSLKLILREFLIKNKWYKVFLPN